MKTDAERRAYGRGYNAGRRNGYDAQGTAAALAKDYRDRALCGDAAKDCAGCKRWTRGDVGVKWGYCDGDFQWAIEPRRWVEPKNWRDRADEMRVATTEDFGCTNWLPKHPTNHTDAALSQPPRPSSTGEG